MTKEEIIELAKQAGFERLGHTAEDWVCHFEDIEEFTKLVAEKAIKEALAKEKALQALHDENERLGLYKDAYAEQEPMAWISTGPARMIHWTSDKPAYGDDWVPLYTTPPQRTWAGLTLDDIPDDDTNNLDFYRGGRWAERVLKEKNT